MSWGTAYLLLLIKSTAVVGASHWKLAFNIHGSDGHNFGYHQAAWEDKTNVGKDRYAFRADYKNYDVTLEDANFIAIVRHWNGMCQAARVWEFVAFGKSLQSYLDRSKTSGLMTLDNYTYSYISRRVLEVENDPFFSADGGLVFNLRWSDNGVRIGNRGWPSTLKSDNFQGLGNTFNINYKSVWHDVGDKCRQRCRTQGTDRGNDNPGESRLYAHYAVFISDAGETFPCLRHQRLKIVMQVPTTPSPTTSTYGEFKQIDWNGDGFLNFFELAFHHADTNSDNQLSFEEYEAALRNIWNKED